MRLLFDTQLWVWFASAQSRFPKAARDLLTDPANDLVWSVVTVWEVAIKRGLGREDFAVEPQELLQFLRDGPFEELTIAAEHTLPVVALPHLHKDPFDRLLIGQAIAEGLMLVTTDEKIGAYSGPICRV